MMHFIYVCMAFLIISFVGVPIYKGVSSEHEKLTTVAQAETNQKDDSLSFNEIYALADETPSNPAFLNDIVPAAGGDATPDTFSSGFRVQEDSALADIPKEIIIEQENDL